MKGPVVKIAISLPRDLLRAVDRRRGRSVSRSEFFRSAVRDKLDRDDAEQASRSYVDGYLADPEDEDEIAAARATAALLAAEPWE